MAQDDTKASEDLNLDAARADLADALDGAALGNDVPPGDPEPDLVKVGSGGLTIELRLNGETIPLAGKDVNQLAREEFQPFVEAQRLEIENGAADDAIRNALSKPGPGKALARVRAVEN